MGATAIEDKLQDGVPDAIANLAEVSQKEGHTNIDWNKYFKHCESSGTRNPRPLACQTIALPL